MSRPLILSYVLLCGLAFACDDDEAEAETGAPEATPEAAPPEREAPPPTEGSRDPRAEQAPAVDLETARRFRNELRLARIAHRGGDDAEALVHYTAAVEADPSGRALCELGWVQFRRDDLDAAERSMSRAMARLPTTPPVPEAFVGAVGSCFYNQGRVHEARGNLVAARGAYERSLEIRPGNRIVAARLASLDETPAAGPAGGAPAAPRCHEDAAELVDFDAITTELVGLRSDPESFNPLLARLGMEPVLRNDSFLDPYGDSLRQEELDAQAEIRRVRMEGPDGAGTAFHVTVSIGDNQSDHVAVWYPRPEGKMCLVGTFNEFMDMCSTSCLGDGAPMSVQAVRLVTEDVDGLQVETNRGACACGADRGATSATTFYGIEDRQLVEYTTIATYSAWYTSPTPPVREDSATITLSDSFPRTITVAARTTCQGNCTEEEFQRRRRAIEAAPEAEAQELEYELYDSCGYYSTECEETTETALMRYGNGTYAEVDAPRR